MVNNGILVNLKTCTGCYACPVACQVARELADTEWWVTIKTNGNPNAGEYLDDPAGDWSNVSSLKMSWLPTYTPKCDLCAMTDQVRSGKDPFCVVNCPNRALTYGDMDDPISKISLALAAYRDRGYKISQLSDAGTTTRAAIWYAKK
jgi:Fe-S-cluster-containing dehydrogenase component